MDPPVEHPPIKYVMDNQKPSNTIQQVSPSSYAQQDQGQEKVVISARTGKPKRRKAVRACTNCQRTHLTCDNNRPCERCIKRGCESTCHDGVRKKPKQTINQQTVSGGIPSKYPPPSIVGYEHAQPHQIESIAFTPQQVNNGGIHYGRAPDDTQYTQFQNYENNSFKNFQSYYDSFSTFTHHRPQKHRYPHHHHRHSVDHGFRNDMLYSSGDDTSDTMNSPLINGKNLNMTIDTQSPFPEDSIDKKELIFSAIPPNPLTLAHCEHSGYLSYGYREPDINEVYQQVTEPFPYWQKLSQMLQYLKRRLSNDEYTRLHPILRKLKTSFQYIHKSLTKDDLVFIEQSFQRSVKEEEKQMELINVPCLAWRWTGEIAAVSPKFATIVDASVEQLKRHSVFDLMDNKGIVQYFLNMKPLTQTGNVPEFKFDCQLTYASKQISTNVEVTIRRDLFNMPLTILGKFWVK